MTTITLREYCAGRDLVPAATRGITIAAHDDYLELRLLSSGVANAAVPALQLRWADRQGWHIVVNQRDDRDIVEILVPDDGGPIHIADL